MNNAAKRYWASVGERVVATFVVAYLGVAALSWADLTGDNSPATVSQLLNALAWNEKAIVAGVIAVLSLVKNVLGKWAGNKATPSWLPASLDPATPPGQIDT